MNAHARASAGARAGVTAHVRANAGARAGVHAYACANAGARAGVHAYACASAGAHISRIRICYVVSSAGSTNYYDMCIIIDIIDDINNSIRKMLNHNFQSGGPNLGVSPVLWIFL